jgi:hypothetical protein
MRSTIGCDRVRFSRNVMHTPGDHEYNNAFLNSSSVLLCRIWSRADNTVADMNFFWISEMVWIRIGCRLLSDNTYYTSIHRKINVD